MAHWNYRVCVFTSPEGHEKIGVFEVYYDDKKEPIMRSKDPKLSWFISKCEGPPSVEQAKKEAGWDLKAMLKAFRAPTLDAIKDF